ncbi:GDP-mannose 4,6-dehydratase [Rhodospirillaceae bacterium LM-1]|nr:GDP-mannose 4,6-dehydratase [Rhodospirillaceae bacterium LM-1]
MPGKALIFGVSGQDGAYLARHLLDKGYEVHGTSRDADLADFSNLQTLGIREQVRVHSAMPTDFRSVVQVVTSAEPTEIYNLAGQSSVSLSFDLPAATLESIAMGTLNILEAIRMLDSKTRFYNACSSECFGNTEDGPASEATPFRPRSPYAVAKAASYWVVTNYREAYGLFACSGILFNHESPLRQARFVTRKIVDTAKRIAGGSNEKLKLGRLDVQRDWGWAPEYVEAMSKMLTLDKPDDFVIATGQSHSLEEFVDETFKALGLVRSRHVETDPVLQRPIDLSVSRGDPSKARQLLGWQAQSKMPDVIRKMIAGQA